MINYKEFFQKEVLKVLEGKGFIVQDALISQSNRPDISDYQSNISLVLGKQQGLNPREIANSLAEDLSANGGLYSVRVDGPGFINFSLSNKILEDNSEIFSFCPSGRTIIIDYGGPNIAKALHVGHLRAAVIGESLKRIMREVGDRVIGDVHFGDWGTPIGMLISQLKKEGIDWRREMDIESISELYKRASLSFKEEEGFKEQARIATSELQAGNVEYMKLWQKFHDVSISEIKKIYERLDVNFDLWLGESDVNDILPEMFIDLQKKGLAVESEGAVIVRLNQLKGRDRAPFILRKTDGAYTYAATDLATIIQRVKDYNPDGILYVVDARQREHFEQVFEVARRAGYVREEVSLEHLGFGTVNGSDGKPFKTREGGVMNLVDLLSLAEEKARDLLPDFSEGVSEEELRKQAEQVAIGGIKYQDLKNNRISDYIFDTDNFTKTEGRTGAYIQYAIVRINSILSKAKEKGYNIARRVKISHGIERELMLTLERYPEFILRAYEIREPSEISEYAYILAQKFSSLYSELNILGEEDEEKRASRLKILELTRDCLKKMLWLLGISSPERMLRKD